MEYQDGVTPQNSTPLNAVLPIHVESRWELMEEMGLLEVIPNHWCRFRNVAILALDEDVENLEQSVYKYSIHFRELSSVEVLPDYIFEVSQALDR